MTYRNPQAWKASVYITVEWPKPEGGWSITDHVIHAYGETRQGAKERLANEVTRIIKNDDTYYREPFGIPYNADILTIDFSTIRTEKC